MRRARFAIVLCVAAMAVTACGLIPGTGGGGGGTTVNALDLEPGVCFDDPASGQFAEVPVVPCNQAHVNEVFAVLDYPAGGDEPFPGNDALNTYGTEECRGSPFSDYVGLDYEDSVFLVFTIVPSEGTWSQGDREIVCSLYQPGNEPITGTARNSNR